MSFVRHIALLVYRKSKALFMENLTVNAPRSLRRVVKGFFVIRERPFLFPVNCEMANFFLVKRDLVTEP